MYKQTRKQVHIKNGILYSVYELQKLAAALPAKNISLSELNIDFDEPLWKDEASESDHKYSMNDVIKGRFENVFLQSHYERAINSNLSIPILVDGGRNRIIDGYHRVLKAKLEGKDEVGVKVFASLPSTAIIKPSD